jgi:hypothetical protein
VAGRYRSEELDAVYEIGMDLKLRRGWQDTEPLVWASPRVAGSRHGVLEFEDRGFVMGTPRATGLRFRRL